MASIQHLAHIQFMINVCTFSEHCETSLPPLYVTIPGGAARAGGLHRGGEQGRHQQEAAARDRRGSPPAGGSEGNHLQDL